MITINPRVVWYVTINDVEYVRSGSDSWQLWYGESLESVYDCARLEEMFQAEMTLDRIEEKR